MDNSDFKELAKLRKVQKRFVAAFLPECQNPAGELEAVLKYFNQDQEA